MLSQLMQMLVWTVRCFRGLMELVVRHVQASYSGVSNKFRVVDHEQPSFHLKSAALEPYPAPRYDKETYLNLYGGVVEAYV